MADGRHTGGYGTAGAETPCDLGAEAACIAVLLLDGDGQMGVAARLTSLLAPEDFGAPDHALLWSAGCAVLARGDVLDVRTMADELRARGRLETVGGVQRLGEITDDVVTVAGAEAWAAIVLRDARARRVVRAAETCARRAAAGGEDLPALARRVMDVATEERSVDLVHVATALEEEEARYLGDAPSNALTTGLRDLDRLLAGGLWPGQLVVVGARPSVGKSALALLMAWAAARACAPTGEGVVVYVSLEMPRRDLAARLGCLVASDDFDGAGRRLPPVDLQRARERKLNGEEGRRYTRALGHSQGLHLLLCDRRGVRPSQVRALVLGAKARHGRVALVVVDYLQLLAPETARETREREVAEASRALQALAGEIGAPVVALSQLNRKAADDKRRPTMADLRESGAIEQDADVILLLHREEGDRQRPVVLVEKQRNGRAPDEVPLGWIAEAARFEDRDMPRAAHEEG